jgi:membrane associated rhomboid family serine protease
MRCPECARQRTRVMTTRTMHAQPTVTYALIAINVVAFLAELVSGLSLGGSNIGASSIVNHGALSRFTVAHGDYWRLITSGFLHASLWHIAFNMWALYILGQILEPLVGHVRFALIYFVSLLAGSFGALVVTKVGFTVGASGAVFGLLGAGILVLRNRGFDVMQTGLPLILGINLLFSFTFSGISVGGHIGGLIGGSLAALALQAADRMRRPELGYVALAGLVAVAAVAGVMLADQGGFSSA